jgi:putative transposase
MTWPVVTRTPTAGQFWSQKFVHALNRHDMVGSMGRVGAAGDNAAMESFFSLLQKNVLDRRTWATREELWIARSSGGSRGPTTAVAGSPLSDG